MIEFFIPDLPKTPNQLLRKHWSVVMREKNKWHKLVTSAVNYKGEPQAKAKLTLTRHSTSEPDFDGNVGSWKFVIDGLVKAGVLVDDRYSVIGESVYRWERCKRNAQGVNVRIEW